MKAKIVLFMVCLAGFAMGYAAYHFGSHTIEMLNNGAKVQATVIDLEHVRRKDSSNYYPVFQYNFKNRLYVIRSKTGSNPPSYKQGETTELTVDTLNPQEFVESQLLNRWGLTGMFGIFSLILSCAGVFGLYFNFRKDARKKWLKTNGQIVSAKVTNIGLNTGLQVNGNSPWKITAQWLDPMTNVVHIFHSDNLWFNPAEYVSETIEVRIDKNDPSIHDMVLTRLPKAA